MAKAVANCKCGKCGRAFTTTAVKYSRQEADNWQAWAEANIDICPDCSREQAENRQIASAAEIREVKYAEYKKHYQDRGYKTVRDSYDPQSKTIKVIISKKNAFCEEFASVHAKYHNGEQLDQAELDYMWESLNDIINGEHEHTAENNELLAVCARYAGK